MFELWQIVVLDIRILIMIFSDNGLDEYADWVRLLTQFAFRAKAQYRSVRILPRLLLVLAGCRPLQMKQTTIKCLPIGKAENPMRFHSIILWINNHGPFDCQGSKCFPIIMLPKHCIIFNNMWWGTVFVTELYCVHPSSFYTNAWVILHFHLFGPRLMHNVVN